MKKINITEAVRDYTIYYADFIEKLAKVLHESGREAVEKGLVYMKGDNIPKKPFCEWNDLPEDAKEGRRVQARFLHNHPDWKIYYQPGENVHYDCA